MMEGIDVNFVNDITMLFSVHLTTDKPCEDWSLLSSLSIYKFSLKWVAGAEQTY